MKNLITVLMIILIFNFNMFAQNSSRSKSGILKLKNNHKSMIKNNVTLLGTWVSDYYLYDVYYTDNNAYISRENGGLVIVDVSNPINPTSIGGLFTEDLESSIFVSNTYAYTVGASYDWSTGYFRIVDISSPTNPIEVFCYDLGEYASGIYVIDEYAYIAQHFGGLKILDISVPSVPTEVGFCQPLDWGSGIFVEGDFAYVVGSVGGGWVSSWACLSIVNVSNPSNPIVTGTDSIFIDFVTDFRDVFVSGNYAYLGCHWSDWEGYTNGMRLDVYDISNHSQPIGISHHDSWVNDISIYNEFAYIAGDSCLLILDINDPSSPQAVGCVDSVSSFSLSCSGDIIYLVGGKTLYVLRNNLISGIAENESAPSYFDLKQNYPNPFNPTTVISWQLAVSSPVKLSIYNLAGQRVATLVNEHQPAGNHTIEFDGSALASGVYLYRLNTERYTLTRKMVLMK